MTHEATPVSEADHGPEHDPTLPDALSVPVGDGPDDLPPIDHPAVDLDDVTPDDANRRAGLA
jgi:hypothetical protein